MKRRERSRERKSGQETEQLSGVLVIVCQRPVGQCETAREIREKAKQKKRRTSRLMPLPPILISIFLSLLCLPSPLTSSHAPPIICLFISIASPFKKHNTLSLHASAVRTNSLHAAVARGGSEAPVGGRGGEVLGLEVVAESETPSSVFLFFRSPAPSSGTWGRQTDIFLPVTVVPFFFSSFTSAVSATSLSSSSPSEESNSAIGVNLAFF